MTRRAIPAAVERRVREASRHRCGYCHSPQHLVMARLHLEHIIPLARGGTDDEMNLWLACPICNGHKSEKIVGIDPITGAIVPLYNPRRQPWIEHFRWSDNGLLILGTTPTGRATVVALHLNDDPEAMVVRSYWVQVGWYPPAD